MFRKAIMALVAIAIAGVAVWYTAFRDQNAPVVVGVLHPTVVDETTFAGFRERMGELGYVDGETIVYMYDGPAGKGDPLRARAQQLVEADVDLIFASSTPATKAAKAATAGTDIPVVFGPVNDPVAAGVVTSEREPGGNVTGVRLPQSGGKRLEWFKQVAPDIQVILFPYSADDASSTRSLAITQDAAAALDMRILPHPVANGDALLAMLAAIPEEADAIYLPRDAAINGNIGDIVAAAKQADLPTSVPGIIQVRQGALVTYGMLHSEVGRMAADLADRVLRGLSPAEVPVETADSFLAVNMNTATEINLTIPDDVLRHAREIIR